MIATAISELARNILKYAREGEIVVEGVQQNGRAGVSVIARDEGPGIADVGLAMQDGYSSGKQPWPRPAGDAPADGRVRDRLGARPWHDGDCDQMAAGVGASALAEWGASARPIPGETVSGDDHVAVALPSWLLFAVVDGLGHGPEAARASAAAVRILESDPGARPEELIRRCHEALRRTRGVAMTIACVDAVVDEVVWFGVGNVQAALLQPESRRCQGAPVGAASGRRRGLRAPLGPSDQDPDQARRRAGLCDGRRPAGLRRLADTERGPGRCLGADPRRPGPRIR